MAFLLIVGLFVSLFILPIWYTHNGAWIFNALGSTIVISIISIFLFLGIFGLSYVIYTFDVSFNEWVYEVEDMDFWFNSSFITWLFAKHPKRWAKWQTVITLILAIYLGVFLFWAVFRGNITQESLIWGTLFSIAAVGLFSFFFYKSYVLGLEASQ